MLPCKISRFRSDLSKKKEHYCFRSIDSSNVYEFCSDKKDSPGCYSDNLITMFEGIQGPCCESKLLLKQS